MRRPHQKRETSVDRSLDRVHEVHWKALSATATLEEESEKLHRMRGHSQLEVRPQKLGLPEVRRNVGGKMLSGYVLQANPPLADLLTLVHHLVRWSWKMELPI